MVIARWEPFRDALSLQRQLNSLVQDFARSENQNELLTNSSFAPPVDIYEDEHQLTLKLETPGIRQEDLDVRVENQTLTIRGERRFDKEEKEENFHRVEHHYGSFSRSFSLPSTVDTSNAKAEYENGVLRLSFEKRAEAKPKQIKVNVVSAGGKHLEGSKPAAKAEAPKSAA